MWILLIGLALFLVPHSLRELGLRDALIKSLPSIGVYKGLFSLVALAGVSLIVLGKAGAPFIMVWRPLFEWQYLSLVLMIPALVLFMAGNLPGGYLRREVRNPMLLGVCLWGIAHLWANGDLASILLFGSLTLWAGAKFIVRGLAHTAPSNPPAVLWDVVAIASGLVLYAILVIYHGPLFGVGLVDA